MDLKILLLAVLFGTGSWIAITGLWLEMPLLTQNLPEGWTLASHLNIVIQLANLGPLVYWLLSNRCNRYVNDISGTHIQFLFGLLSCFILIFKWNKTVKIFSEEYSLYLMIGTFGLALVDCTSSVTFLPFMARFDSRYMTPYLVGEGLSGFIPSLVVMLQGVEDQNSDCPGLLREKFSSPKMKPKFSVEIFFVSLLVTLAISYLAFICLQFLPFAKREQERMAKLQKTNNSNGDMINKTGRDNIRRSTYYYYQILIFFNCFTTFGFMPSLQPYSALPYSSQALYYVVLLAGISYPVGCFLAMIYKIRTCFAITLLSLIALALPVVITYGAWLSPNPPFADSEWQWHASWIVVLIWILFVLIASYVKTVITLIICDYNSQKGMFWVGMNTQFGSAIGAGLIFVLINHLNIFKQCPRY